MTTVVDLREAKPTVSRPVAAAVLVRARDLKRGLAAGARPRHDRDRLDRMLVAQARRTG